MYSSIYMMVDPEAELLLPLLLFEMDDVKADKPVAITNLDNDIKKLEAAHTAFACASSKGTNKNDSSTAATNDEKIEVNDNDDEDRSSSSSSNSTNVQYIDAAACRQRRQNMRAAAIYLSRIVESAATTTTTSSPMVPYHQMMEKQKHHDDNNNNTNASSSFINPLFTMMSRRGEQFNQNNGYNNDEDHNATNPIMVEATNTEQKSETESSSDETEEEDEIEKTINTMLYNSSSSNQDTHKTPQCRDKEMKQSQEQMRLLTIGLQDVQVRFFPQFFYAFNSSHLKTEFLSVSAT